MANSKPPKKNTGSKTAGKPVRKAVKKTARKKTTKKPAATTAKRVSVAASKTGNTTTVHYIPDNGEPVKTFTWAHKAWSKAGQTTDPATKILRDFVDKMAQTGKEILLPKDARRRIFETIEKIDFTWYSSSNKDTEPLTETMGKTPAKAVGRKAATGKSARKRVKKNVKKTVKKTAQKTAKKVSPRSKPPARKK